MEWYVDHTRKPRSRKTVIFNNEVSIPLTLVKNTYIIAHYNVADLSMLSDFEELKTKLSIVNNSFVSLGKPLR